MIELELILSWQDFREFEEKQRKQGLVKVPGPFIFL